VEGPIRERGIPGTLGALDHALGLIQLHEGQTGKARASLERAAAFWTGRRRFWESTQALLDQAKCATRSRRPGEAAIFTAQARTAAAAVGAKFDIPPAPAALFPGASTAGASTAGASTAGARPDRPASTAGPVRMMSPVAGVLTARENEIARVVALGMTNKEIAAALTISPKTVAAHVEHILAKLGFSRRAQIATWAASRS
jgi:DNA-binding CsgD family transcriptional regulator